MAGGRLPELIGLGPLSRPEWDAVRSLVLASLDLRQEWELACGHVDALMTKYDVVGEYCGSSPWLQFHSAALAEAVQAATGHEYELGAVAWRYAGTAAVVAMAVMDRLLCGRPPLTPEQLAALTESEPTLGALKEAAGEPYARMIAAKKQDSYGTEAKARLELLGLLEGTAAEMLAERFEGRHLTRAEVDGSRLGPAQIDGMEPWWTDLLKPVSAFAEEAAHAVVWWANDAQAPASP